MSIKSAVFVAALLLTTAPAAFADALTENQARSVLGNECNNVSTLSRDGQGNWHSYCSKGAMMVDSSGKVSADKYDSKNGLTEAHARSLMGNECNNVSTLSQDGKGMWHGYCSKGAMMVNADGKVVADSGGIANGITEAHARAIAADNCNNVSTLYTDGNGGWRGSCAKGAITIDKAGKFAVN